jgi:hypothetical protein
MAFRHPPFGTASPFAPRLRRGVVSFLFGQAKERNSGAASAQKLVVSFVHVAQAEKPDLAPRSPTMQSTWPKTLR